MRDRIVYVDEQEGPTNADKFDQAVEKCISGGLSGRVILPPKWFEVDRSLCVWRRRGDKRNSASFLENNWKAYTNLDTTMIPSGIHIEGTAGNTKIRWMGGSNNVVMDLPGAWWAKVSGIQFENVSNADNVIGLRTRVPWEFGRNGSKMNQFIQLNFDKFECGIECGDPFLPDQVSNLFQTIKADACDTGLRYMTANVASQVVQGCYITNVNKGIHLMGVGGRTFEDNEVVDGQGNIFEWGNWIPQELINQKVTMRDGKHQVGGGSPTVHIHDFDVTAKGDDDWAIFAERAYTFCTGARHEGGGGFLRSVGGSGNRFTDFLRDCSLTSRDVGIHYDRATPLEINGGSWHTPSTQGPDPTACQAEISEDCPLAFGHVGDGIGGWIDPSGDRVRRFS